MFLIIKKIIPLFIAYHTGLKVNRIKIDKFIQFLDTYCLSLRCKGHFNNSYNFLKM